MIQLQIVHRLVRNVLRKSFGVLHRRDLGLHDDFIARQGGQDGAELHLRRAVAARGFNMVDAEFDGAMDGGFEIFLVRTAGFPWDRHPAI